MSQGFLSFLALSPVLTVFILIVLFRRPATRAMPIAFLVTASLAAFIWKTPPLQIVAAAVDGLVTAASILYIVLGAVLLLNLLRESGAIPAIRRSMDSVSPDRRIQAVIIAFLFGSFIEAAAGFGTPAAVAAPLLVAIGFPAMAAVMVSLIIQSTAVTFGAIGTPILIGVRAGLSGQPEVMSFLGDRGIALADFLNTVGGRAALIHGITGTLIPLILIVMMTRFFGKNRSWTEGLAAAPFALCAGLCFTVPYTLAGLFLGPEFPSLIGSLVGLTAVIFLARSRFLRPRRLWDFPDRREWPGEWSGEARLPEDEQAVRMSVFRAWSPYLLVAVFLLLSRMWTPLKQALSSVTFRWDGILGTSITTSFQPLFLPGFLFLVVSVLTIRIQKVSGPNVRLAVRRCLGSLAGPAVALAFAVAMVKVFINSGVEGGLDRMPVVLAGGAASLWGRSWSLAAAPIGAMGAFIAGSNTFSNMMFALFQFATALKTSADPSVIVALQAVGGAAGNMICVHNVVAASAVVGLLGKEGALIRKTFWPMLYYLAAAGLIGLFLLRP